MSFARPALSLELRSFVNVSEPLRTQTVLIVDEDLGFVFWLGQALADVGHQVVPALSCEQAFFHIRHFNVDADAVFVNPALSGVPNLLQTLGRANTRLRIVLIKSPDMEVSGAMPAHALLEKPRGWEEISRQEWLLKVETILTDEPPLASCAGSA
jgi:DNA-binding NtrC family response regulator